MAPFYKQRSFLNDKELWRNEEFRHIMAKLFIPYVDKLGPDECWPWMGACRGPTKDRPFLNIPAAVMHRFNIPRKVIVARLVWCVDRKRRIPLDKLVRHWKCDNAVCCNPRHLRLGTHQDNADDAVIHGLIRRGKDHPNWGNQYSPRGEASPNWGKKRPGEASGHSKLTDKDVIRIRKRHAAGVPQTHLAEEYGVTSQCIGHVVLGKSWAHLLKQPLPKRQKRVGRKLTADKVRAIRKWFREGVSESDLARAYGVSQPNIGYIVRGETWKHV